MEEINEESISNMLSVIPKNLSPIERIIISNEGTVQTLLSVLFEVPVQVVVLNQTTVPALYGKQIVRWSKLVAKYSPSDEITICLAESIVSTDDEGFINGMNEKKMGIGQLIAAKDIPTRRRILGFHSDDCIFARNYVIEDVGMTEIGNHLSCLISEVFPKTGYSRVNQMQLCTGVINRQSKLNIPDNPEPFKPVEYTEEDIL